MTTSDNKRKVETFVLMPYGSGGEYREGVNESNFIFHEIICEGVKRAAQDSDWFPAIQREVDRSQAGSITTTLVESIVKSEIVIVDITGRNANVFLELGIRYGLRDRITLLLAQEGTDIPFDIRGYRYIAYNPFKPELAREKIKDFLL